MSNINSTSRRVVIKSSLFGLLTAFIPNVIFAKEILPSEQNNIQQDHPDSRYPSINEAIVAEVVGVSHFNLDRLKQLVNQRPELARATWDWGFGDWETALGAASHVGRKDIAEFLISKGARPDIFTFAMLGSYDAVKAMIETSPGIQAIAGPHGISLLQHVKNGIENNNSITENTKKLIAYLESLGNADSPVYTDLSETDKQKYLGDYKYGDGPKEGFSIKMNRRKLITLGKLGDNGGALYKISDNKFIYNGTSSVSITFLEKDNKVISLTIIEPNLTLIAKKI